MIPRKQSLSDYTSPKVDNFQIFILSPLHPSGKPYLAKSEICTLVKPVGFDFHRSVHQLNYKITRAIWLIWQIAKYKLALALQGFQATYPTILVAMITKHTICYVTTH